MVIIAILATMLVPLYSSYREHAFEVKCMGNLRNLYVAASGYLEANKSWPQIPANLFASDPLTYAKSWVQALTPYGAPHPVWICPSLQASLQLTMDDIETDAYYRIDYIAPPFDSSEGSPRRSSRHPWFVETAGLHSRGNLLILADGTTTSILDLSVKPAQ